MSTLVSDIIVRVTEQMPKNKPIRGMLGAVRDTVDLVRNRGRWSFFHKIGTVTTVGSYSVGTVAITLGQTSIVGTDTGWTTYMTGRKIRIAGDPVDYTFTYLSGTSGTISPALASATVTAATYTIFSDTYSLASDVQNVIGFQDVTNRTSVAPIGPLIGTNINNWFAQTYRFANTVFQFGRDTNGCYQITFTPPTDTIAVIRYLYYRAPTVVTGPGSTLDLPSELDNVIVHGVLYRLQKNVGMDDWISEKNLFKELLDGRWNDDRAFMTTVLDMGRWDQLYPLFPMMGGPVISRWPVPTLTGA